MRQNQKTSVFARAGFAVIALASATILPATAADAQIFTPLYSFTGEPDGNLPDGGPIFHAGLLYGTTITGGTTDNGAVYTINPATGKEKILYNFAGGSDGAQPEGDLLFHGAAFYGTTSFGGTFNAGTIVKLDPKTGAESVLYSFGAAGDGTGPSAGLIVHDDILYGTTTTGGASDLGTVFSFVFSSGTETVLHSFAGGADGSKPFAGLVFQKGNLYGDTFFGGSAGNGTVFKVNTASGKESVLFAFPGKSFQGNPSASLTYDNGTLYGTTANGGLTRCGGSKCGTVFKIDAATGAETTLYSFNGRKDGQDPEGGLVLLGGLLYGATQEGGPLGLGNIFKIDPATGIETVLHVFKGAPDGINPGTLKFHAGALYGATRSGGAGGFGGVFKLTP
jgi:uncharacterized repeat protein (TIGR03803 family)